MKVNELQFGNIIYSLGQRHENGRMLEWINYEIPVDLEVLQNIISKNTDFEYSPIPLTEEWLLKLGFENKHTNIFTKQIIISECTAQEKLKLEGWAGNISLIVENQFASNGCKHVHELQNLYFALTGEELLK